MQKLFRSLLAVGALAGLAACGDDVTVTPPPTPDITITGAPVTAVAVGSKVQLNSNVAATWTSSNAAVASVDATGLVTAVAAGTASITATSSADATKKASVTITVTAPATNVRSVTVSPSSSTLTIGSTLQLVANVDADAGVARTVTWASSNSAVATVSTAGVVTAVSSGAASITAASTVAPTVVGASAITVTPNQPASVSIQSITYNVAGLLRPVDVDNVAGQIDITLNVDPGSGVLSKVSVQVDGVEAASQTFGAIQAEASLVDLVSQVVLSVPTAKFNATTGVPLYKNGPRVIKAVLETKVGGSTVTGSASVTTSMIFRNLSGFVGTLVTANGQTATDQGGFQWKSGDATVTALPVLYGDQNAPFTVPTIANVTLSIGLGATCQPANGSLRTKAAALSGTSWTATWANSGNQAATNLTGYEFQPGSCPGLLTLGEVPNVGAVGGDGNGIFLISCSPLNGEGVGFLNSPYCTGIVGGPQPDSRFAARLDNLAPTRSTNPASGGFGSQFLTTNTTRPIIRTGNWVNDALVLNGVSPDNLNPLATGSSPNIGNDINGGPSGIYTRRNVLTQAFDLGSSRLSNTTQLTYITRVGVDVATADAATPVTSVAGIPESGVAPIFSTPTGPLVIRARVSDIVGNLTSNSTASSTWFIAVDRTAPTLAIDPPSSPLFGTDPTKAVRNVAPLSVVSLGFAASDAATGGAVPSGFFNLAGSPLITSVQRQDPNNGSNQWWCPTTVDWRNAPNAGSCTAWVTGTSFEGPLTQFFTLFGTVEAYYTVTSLVGDQAGNQSGNQTGTMLYDISPPAIGGVSFPAFLNGGSNVTFSTQANDNLDLASGTLFIAYTAFPEQFQFPTTALGTYGPDVFTTNAAVSLSQVFIRSIQVSGPAAPGAGFSPPTSVSALVTDVAGNNSAPSATPISAGSIPVGTATQAGSTNWVAGGAFTWSITLLNGAAPAAINVNRDATPVTPNVSAVTITACAVGPTGTFQNPFTSRVDFWVQAAGATWRQIGTTQSPSVTDNGTIRSWCFSNTWDPSGAYTAPFAPGSTVVNIIAIGVNGIPVAGSALPAGTPAGDALATPANANVTVVVP